MSWVESHTWLQKIFERMVRDKEKSTGVILGCFRFQMRKYDLWLNEVWGEERTSKEPWSYITTMRRQASVGNPWPSDANDFQNRKLGVGVRKINFQDVPYE